MDKIKIPKSELKLGRELARGHFGIVYEGMIYYQLQGYNNYQLQQALSSNTTLSSQNMYKLFNLLDCGLWMIIDSFQMLYPSELQYPLS